MDVLAEYYHWPDPVTATIAATAAATAAAPAAATAATAAVAATTAGATTAAAAGMSTAAMVGIGMSAAGLGLGAYGTIRSGQAAAAQAKGQEAMAAYNAKVQEQDAEAATQQSLYRQQLHNRDASRRMSSLQALLAASGADPSAGTPLLIQSEQAKQDEMDRLMIAYQGQIASGRSLSMAGMDRLQGGIYGQQAKNAKTTGYVNAGATLLTGFGKYASIKSR